MEMGLEGKTALVTGASSQGIGRAIAKGLAAEGVQLCIAARRRELLDQLAEEIVAARGKKPHVVPIDLLERDAPARLAQEALAKLGNIGILMNCAGGGGGHFGINASEELWEREANFNFTMQRKLMLAVVPDMIKNKFGRIVSITGKLEPPRELKCDPPRGVYGATAFKAAMHGFSKSLSNEIGRYGVTVNCLAPGKIMSEQIRRKHDERERKALAEEEIPVGRYGEPEELARLAVFLASPYSGFITGIVIMVDGGMRRYPY
jgi:3-oxoacyl-[acyl-carrier protein] reductase